MSEALQILQGKKNNKMTKVKKKNKKVSIKKPVTKITKVKSVKTKSAPRKIIVRREIVFLKPVKIVTGKVETHFIITDERKVPIRKMVQVSKFFPNNNVKENYIKSPSLFFSYAVMKSLALIIILALNALSLSNIGTTNSYYKDIEASNGNIYHSGEIDFTLTNGEFLPTTSLLNLGVGDTATKEITINIGDSNPFKYLVEGKNFTGDTDFCDALNAKFSVEGTEMYNNSLSSLITGETETLDSWELILTMPTTLQNKICNFDTEYKGSQTRHDYPLMDGYNDTETVSHKIFSWGFRINKIYYDVDPAHGIEGDNEWVEVYNQTDTALDISGWEICDNNSCDTTGADTPLIPAKGYGVITNANSTWSFWDIPSDVVKIELGEDIGNGLSNSGDELILKRPDGVVMDEMNWQNDISVWNPGSVDVPEGHMLGREPNGYDTNQPSDFIDLAPPTVLLINPNQSGNQTWYWTYIYNILWNATNPNGPDSDIKINLYWIKDIDQSQTITPADETLPIATDLSNSGTYSWTLPGGFLGYIWVKIVAVGPENPMLNAHMISGKVWDPFPTEMWSIDREMVMESIIEMMNPDIAVDEEDTTEENITEDVTANILEDTSSSSSDSTPATTDMETSTDTEILADETVGEIETVEDASPIIVPEVVTEILEVVETMVETVVEEETPAVIEETPVVVEESAPAEPTPEPAPEPDTSSADSAPSVPVEPTAS